MNAADGAAQVSATAQRGGMSGEGWAAPRAGADVAGGRGGAGRSNRAIGWASPSGGTSSITGAAGRGRRRSSRRRSCRCPWRAVGGQCASVRGFCLRWQAGTVASAMASVGLRAAGVAAPTRGVDCAALVDRHEHAKPGHVKTEDEPSEGGQPHESGIVDRAGHRVSRQIVAEPTRRYYGHAESAKGRRIEPRSHGDEGG